ncbi:hypothetical protein NQ035_05315 [Staphylococcus gallinarum]|uniref:Uncharacterized protein n=1 Tax=Staphylococcus gallinarum TaxID=1293 RepID=A0A418HPR4_STAGA|nr:hypothetical protein [Staphylococcus gallinarum]MCD8826336.1 hypothetical protein [Staphylococcus gallinarum]MCD8871474.1 hypothetical protein [Staphylococcus gallinarum]MCQ9288283.1 hypothetical protein [Staphylococcus gallinarum]MCW0986289.1 hypothetical protein [Staphylococcus gallinarum]PTE77016.1 hypothetical protein BUY96_06930 [Staphylococcus gallinarum]
MIKFTAIFQNLLKIKATWLYLAFGLLPLALFLIMYLNPNFMNISGEKHTLGCLEFFSMVFSLQDSTIISMIILIYVVSLNFYTEKEKGQLYFYKDLPKGRLLNSKLCALLLLYLMFVLILFLSSVTIYYTQITHTDLASHHFLPLSDDSWNYIVVEFLGTLYVQIICIFLSVILSIHFPNGYTIFGAIGFIIITSITPLFKGVKYIFPNGYLKSLSNSNFAEILTEISLLFILYIAIFYIISIISYKKLEY